MGPQRRRGEVRHSCVLLTSSIEDERLLAFLREWALVGVLSVSPAMIQRLLAYLSESLWRST